MQEEKIVCGEAPETDEEDCEIDNSHTLISSLSDKKRVSLQHKLSTKNNKEVDYDQKNLKIFHKNTACLKLREGNLKLRSEIENAIKKHHDDFTSELHKLHHYMSNSIQNSQNIVTNLEVINKSLDKVNQQIEYLILPQLVFSNIQLPQTSAS